MPFSDKVLDKPKPEYRVGGVEGGLRGPKVEYDLLRPKRGGVAGGVFGNIFSKLMCIGVLLVMVPSVLVGGVSGGVSGRS